MMRVVLPSHLKALARVTGEVLLEVPGPLSIRTLLDALEAQLPVLKGSIREHGTGRRRKLLRYFVCGEDWSHEDADRPLPETIRSGAEPLLILGAIAGG